MPSQRELTETPRTTLQEPYSGNPQSQLQNLNSCVGCVLHSPSIKVDSTPKLQGKVDRQGSVPAIRLVSYHPAHHTLNSVLRLLLNLRKSHNSTALTLNVLDQAAQQLIVSATSHSWASIYVLVMSRAAEMSIQRMKGCELAGAEVAGICLAVP